MAASKNNPTNANELSEKALEAIKKEQQKKLFQKELDNQKKLQGLETAFEKKQKEEAKKDARAQATALDNANREIITSLGSKIPGEFNKVVGSLYDFTKKVRSLGSGGFNAAGIAGVGSSLIDMGFAAAQWAATMAEQERQKETFAAEEESLFNAPHDAAKRWAEQMQQYTWMLGQSGSAIIDNAHAFARSNALTFDDMKRFVQQMAHMGMAENLGAGRTQQLQGILDKMATNARMGQNTNLNQIYRNLGEISPEIRRTMINVNGESVDIWKAAMTEYAKSHGGRTDIGVGKEALLHEQDFINIFDRLISKVDLNEKSNNPVLTLQQEMNRRLGTIAEGIMQWLYPVLEMIAEWAVGSPAVEAEKARQTAKDLAKQAASEPDETKKQQLSEQSKLMEERAKLSDREKELTTWNYDNLTKFDYNSRTEAQDELNTIAQNIDELDQKIRDLDLSAVSDSVDNVANQIKDTPPPPVNIFIKVKTTDPDTTVVPEPGGTPSNVTTNQSN